LASLPQHWVTSLSIYCHSRFNRPPWQKVDNKKLYLLILRVDFTILPNSVDFTKFCRFPNSVDFTEVPIDFTRDFLSLRPKFHEITFVCPSIFQITFARFFWPPIWNFRVRPSIKSKKSSNIIDLKSQNRPNFHTKQQIWHIGDLSNREGQ